MEITISVLATELTSERIADAGRDLLKEIRETADPSACFVTQNADVNSKGDLISFSQIALALVSGGAVTKFIQSLFAYLGRHRKIEVEVHNGTGKKLKLKWDYIDSNGEDKAMALVEAFLAKDG